MTAHYEEWDADRVRRRMALPWNKGSKGDATSVSVVKTMMMSGGGGANDDDDEWKLVYPTSADVEHDDGEEEEEAQTMMMMAYASELGTKDAMIEALEETVQRLANYIRYVETEHLGPEAREAAQAWKDRHWTTTTTTDDIVS